MLVFARKCVSCVGKRDSQEKPRERRYSLQGCWLSRMKQLVLVSPCEELVLSVRQVAQALPSRWVRRVRK